MFARAFLTRIGMYPDYAQGDRRDRRSSQRSTVMLNYEYARLVERDRRREIEARLRIERALHPDEPASEARPALNVGPRRGMQPARNSTAPAR